MKIERCKKDSFIVIGKEGATTDGADFIQKLWDDANSHFGEVQHLAKKDENGNISGIWGTMSDFSRSFQPWEEFNQGLYLAGVECNDGAEAPDGWTKWVLPINAKKPADSRIKTGAYRKTKTSPAYHCRLEFQIIVWLRPSTSMSIKP
jgi:hypothetical protein